MKLFKFKIDHKTSYFTCNDCSYVVPFISSENKCGVIKCKLCGSDKRRYCTSSLTYCESSYFPGYCNPCQHFKDCEATTHLQPIGIPVEGKAYRIKLKDIMNNVDNITEYVEMFGNATDTVYHIYEYYSNIHHIYTAMKGQVKTL